MENPGAFLLASILHALTVFSVLAVLLLNSEAADVKGQHGCSPACGQLQDIRHPFRQRGDPPECGVKSYELLCQDGKAIIHLGTGRYFVTDISYNESIFWVVNTDLDNGVCPLPSRWSQQSNRYNFLRLGSEYGHMFGRKKFRIELSLDAAVWVSLVSCSRIITNNSMYSPVACLSANNYSVYLLNTRFSYEVEDLEPSCGCLAIIPLGGPNMTTVPNIANYADVIKLMRSGFAVKFPYTQFMSVDMKECLRTYFRKFHGIPAIAIVVGEGDFWKCVFYEVDFWFVLAPLAVWTFLTYKFFKTSKSIDAVEKFLRKQQTLGPRRYVYTDLIAITSHFREKLGQGGYGSVYKGVLPGDVCVAIKMLSNSMCNGEEFISEVSTIGRIHHVNVVRLVGFCSEEMRRALVYEYMPHGSLDKYIFSSDRSISWDKLNEIALGIARGIDYLHRGCDVQILHFDIKPHNILLDCSFVPKIADFGLAKLYPRDHSLLPMSAARGTIGYIAPEMISRSFGIISSKSDVYSFGMLLLEMAGGRRNSNQDAGTPSQAYYPAWVYERLSRQEVGEISETIDMHDVEKKLCIVGLWCIQMMSRDRPTMSEVVEMLEAGVNGQQIPPEPFFCGDEHIRAMDSCLLSSELSTISEDDA